MTARFLPLDQSDPAEIAGYVLRARLGSGGMGDVYLSFTRGGRPVALKVVRKEFADDPEFRRRFRMEVSAAQRVQGLYTAPVVDADPDAPVPWLATAYIAGPSLSHAVAEHGPLPEFSVFRLLAGVAEGLEAVHAAGLVHRDLKPANVLLAADGPRVIDFGIAHAADATSHTGTGALLGTPAYMTPEQVAGRPVSPATDVFALAHLVVYAATGHSVFGDGHFSALVYRIAQEQPDLTGCPDSLRNFATACLAKDPEQRPTLAEIMVFAKNALAGQTMQLANGSWLPAPVAGALPAYDTSAAPPPAPRPHQATMTAGVSNGAAAVTVPGPAGAGTLPPTTPQTLGPQGPRRRGLKRPGVILPAALVVLLAAVGGGAYLGFDLNSNNAPRQNASGGTPPTAAASSPAHGTATASPSGSALTSPAAPASASASGTAGSANSAEYSTPVPFPLCDPNGAQWTLVNLTPQSSNGCAQPMGAAVTSNGYGFGTTSSFPNGPALTASNSVSVSGALPGGSGYQNWCMGAVEGGAATGYSASVCNSGQWYIKGLTGLGTNGVSVGKQLATGSFPFTSGTQYTVSLTVKPGSATLSITLTQGSGSPLQQTVTIPQFTPTVVGYSFYNENPTLPINPAYPSISDLVYSAGSGS